MATRAQIKANRKDAKKSTGPRTEDDKARVSQNALKHGLLARDTVLPGEDPADFDRQLSALEADIQPANSLEFELVRQIADTQWRMRRLTRLETGFLAAAVDETRRYMEKRRPDELRPGYDGETQLLGSAMLERTQAFVHLARYDGHLSRRFFRAVNQLADLRRDERKSRETRSSADSVGPDPYPGPYVPAQAPPPVDGGARAPGGLSKMQGKTRAREGAGPQARACGSVLQRASSHRRGGCTKRGRKSFVAHALSLPRRDSSRRLQSKTTKQTQSRQTPVKSSADCRSINDRDGMRRLLIPSLLGEKSGTENRMAVPILAGRSVNLHPDALSPNRGVSCGDGAALCCALTSALRLREELCLRAERD